MEKDCVRYGDLVSLIEQYLDQEGITKTCAQILTILANRLSDKLKIIEPTLKGEILSGEGVKRPENIKRLEELTLILEREYRK